jgi:hypothetical protein
LAEDVICLKKGFLEFVGSRTEFVAATSKI